MPRLLRRPGYFLRRHAEGGRAGLPADLHRYLCQGCVRQALRSQDPNHRGRAIERPGDPVLRRARDPALPGADRSRHRVLRQPRAPRVRAIPGDRGYRPYPDQGAEPETNGICERFHKTVLDEFYRIAFRKRIYATIEQLQGDLDAWMAEYNQDRPHQGRWCYGKTPMQTFFDTLPIAKEKNIRAA